jgi:hypothetical protein
MCVRFFSGLQYALPGTWHVLADMGAQVEELSRVWSAGPAKLLGISDITGELSVGKQADIVVSHLLRRRMCPYKQRRQYIHSCVVGHCAALVGLCRCGTQLSSRTRAVLRCCTSIR